MTTPRVHVLIGRARVYRTGLSTQGQPEHDTMFYAVGAMDMNTTPQAFLERYRPKALAEIIGQPDVVAILKSYVASPEPAAWLFCGSSGVGKTAAAYCVANELGADPFWGVTSIPAGKQTAEALDGIADKLWQTTLGGSGWKVLIVNECDQMHPKVEARWLDILENIPPRVCIIFTTNEIGGLPDRFVDRCHRLDFSADWANLSAAQGLVDRVWFETLGHNHSPRVESLIEPSRIGKPISYRRILQSLHNRLMRPDECVEPKAAEQSAPEPVKDIPPIKIAPELKPRPAKPSPDKPTMVNPIDLPEWRQFECWYVAVRDRDRVGLMCGPFAHEWQAKDLIQQVREVVKFKDKQSIFYQFEVRKLASGIRCGKFNRECKWESEPHEPEMAGVA